MPHFVLLNPNTSTAATAIMLEVAREALAGAATIEGLTATAGATTITDEAALAVAATEVAAMAQAAPPSSGALVAAFGDPGLDAARAHLSPPVIGLAEAAVNAAAALGRFSIVTTTPALDAALRARVKASGRASSFANLHYTRSGPAGMADPARLLNELAEACQRALAQNDPAAIIIGGGPLARAARHLRGTLPVALVEPIPAAMRLLLRHVRRHDAP